MRNQILRPRVFACRWAAPLLVAAALPCAGAGLPQANDVVMRTLEFRDVPAGSRMDVFSAIPELHVTRLEWTYLDFDERNHKLVQRVKEMGVLFGGAGSGSLHGSIEHFPRQLREIHMLNLEGEPVVQPHMRAWENFRGVGDPSNPLFYAQHLAYWKRVVDWGAQTLQRDGPESPVLAVTRYGAGFSPSGLAGFQDWLRQNVSAGELAGLGIDNVDTFDYAAYLRKRGAPVGDAFTEYEDPLKPHWEEYWQDVNTRFWERMTAEIKAYAGERGLAFSCNNSSLQMWEPFHAQFDYANSELMLETANPVHIWERARAAREIGKVQVFGAPKTRSQPVEEAEKRLLLRRVYATAYACGMLAKVPWDVYDQSPDGQARYFVQPEDFADLTAFVRAGDWSGYRETAAVGARLPEAAGQAPHIVRGSGGVYAFVREHADGAKPLLVHLVEWGLPREEAMGSRFYTTPSGKKIRLYPPVYNMKRTAPEPFEVVFPRERFGGELPRFRLALPAAYDARAHGRAWESGSYGKLVRSIELEPAVRKGAVRLKIPALEPWGILIIERNR